MITVKVEGLEKLMQGLKRAASELEPIVTEAIRKSGELVKQNAARQAPTFEGTLKRSLTNQPSKLRTEVFVGASSEKYGYVQEYGRKPGKQPPVKALEKWAQAKLGSSSLAFVVARSIGQKGTKPHPFFYPGFEDSIPGIERLLDKAGTKIIEII